MTADVVTLSPSMSVVEVANEMIAKEKGRLPVVEGGRVVAMVTDRDLIAGWSRPAATPTRSAVKRSRPRTW
ncbi:MAG TPA: CBS domain-containing protein [Actinomycetota bacterium]|nr:CBS domain-containing protein [Actinomycetota bacterium]